MRRILFDTWEQARAASPFFIAEDGVGIWLDDASGALAGRRIDVVRDALHVPSVTRSGQPLSLAVRAEALGQAARLGLRDQHAAIGYWTLSDSGIVQEEAVVIVFSATAVDRVRLRALADWLLVAGDQDAVAIEVAGRVEQISRT